MCTGIWLDNESCPGIWLNNKMCPGIWLVNKSCPQAPRLSHGQPERLKKRKEKMKKYIDAE